MVVAVVVVVVAVVAAAVVVVAAAVIDLPFGLVVAAYLSDDFSSAGGKTAHPK